MIKEILQSNTQGLLEKDNYRTELANGFEHSNVTNAYPLHEGYENHAKYFVQFLKSTDKVLELGAGAGNLQYWIKQYIPEIEYATLDINETTKSSPYITLETHACAYSNLPYQFVDENNNQVKFDYILSFEHFEHIHKNTLETFFENIKRHCHANTKVIATASLQNFGGPHITILSKEEWINIINSMGFEMIDEVHLTPENCPPNFEFHQTTDLCFKLK